MQLNKCSSNFQLCPAWVVAQQGIISSIIGHRWVGKLYVKSKEKLAPRGIHVQAMLIVNVAMRAKC